MKVGDRVIFVTNFQALEIETPGVIEEIKIPGPVMAYRERTHLVKLDEPVAGFSTLWTSTENLRPDEGS